MDRFSAGGGSGGSWDRFEIRQPKPGPSKDKKQPGQGKDDDDKDNKLDPKLQFGKPKVQPEEEDDKLKWLKEERPPGEDKDDGQKKAEEGPPKSRPPQGPPRSRPSEAPPKSAPPEAPPKSVPPEASPKPGPSEAPPKPGPSEAPPKPGPSEAPPKPKPIEESQKSMPSEDTSTKPKLSEATVQTKTEEKKPREIIHYAENWVKSFRPIKILLITFGQWPFCCHQDPNQKEKFEFRFSWQSLGFFLFVWTLLFNIYGLASGAINVVDILMIDKTAPDVNHTKTQIIEQALVERHTMVVMIMFGSYGLNILTLVLIITKRNETSEMFTKWTRFLEASKLNANVFRTYTYAGVALINYIIVASLFTLFVAQRTSATFIGGPTVVSIMLTRHFLPRKYLEGKFTNSDLHKSLHILGIAVYVYVTLTSNAILYLFLWLLKTIKNATRCWNNRMSDTLEAIHNNVDIEDLEDEAKDRMDFNILYRDHIGLVRMMSWFNYLFAGIIEPWILFFTVRLVYQIYLAALVVQGNGKPPNKALVGKYFIRQRDYIPALIISYENIFMVVTILFASAWFDDTAYESYDELREKSLMKGTSSDKESFFMLSMFQSYTSTTRLSVYGAGFFTIDRYTILHVLSAIMSNFLVVYQFRPLFDTDTSDSDLVHIRMIIGDFLIKFEGLKPGHTDPVSDLERYRAAP